MRLLLQPRNSSAYGQDFHNSGLKEQCGLTPWLKENERYNQPSDVVELIVSQNPDDPADASFISDFGKKIPVVVHLHCRWGYFSPEQKKCARKAIQNAKIGIVPAEFHRHDMAAKFGDVEWRVVSNGVRPDLFHPTIKRKRLEFRRKYEINKDKKLIGVVGRLENAKGLQIVRKIAEMPAEEDFSLLIQFPNWAELPKKIRDDYTKTAATIWQINPERIVLVEDNAPRSSDRPTKYLDGLLMPSLSEVQPLVVLEALMSGVPVIATRSTPFYREIQDTLQSHEGEIRCIDIVPLPQLYENGLVQRSDCNLTEAEIEAVCPKIVTSIRALETPDDNRRKRLVDLMIKAGFTETDMNRTISAIYDTFALRRRKAVADSL